MSSLFETTHVPDDAAYWDALADRVAARVCHRPNGSGLVWLSHSRAGWVAASLLLVAALALIVRSTEESSTRRPNAVWEQMLAPADDVGKAILSQNAPPAIGALLLAGQDGR